MRKDSEKRETYHILRDVVCLLQVKPFFLCIPGPCGSSPNLQAGTSNDGGYRFMLVAVVEGDRRSRVWQYVEVK